MCAHRKRNSKVKRGAWWLGQAPGEFFVSSICPPHGDQWARLLTVNTYGIRERIAVKERFFRICPSPKTGKHAVVIHRCDDLSDRQAHLFGDNRAHHVAKISAGHGEHHRLAGLCHAAAIKVINALRQQINRGVDWSWRRTGEYVEAPTRAKARLTTAWQSSNFPSIATLVTLSARVVINSADAG